MSTWRITREQLWYGLAFALALVLRLVMLGAAPLSESEAGLALQSLAISHGAHPSLSGQPGSLLVTGALFFFFGGSNFLARLWPALAGSLLALAPLGFRRALGARAALVLAFFLALDPGLVALSRQVGSPLPAVAFTLLALGLWLARKPVWAGIAAGLALLGGAQVWNGLVGLGITVGIALALKLGQTPWEDGETPQGRASPQLERFAWRTAGLAAAITLAAVGTLFWLAPEGLGAVGASLSAYLHLWFPPSGTPITLLLAAFVAEEVLFLGLAICALVNALLRRRRLEGVLGIWLLVALALAVLPPGRQAGSLAWALIPLLGLAAHGLAEIALGADDPDRVPAWVYTGAVLFMLGFIWLNFTGILAAWTVGETTLPVRALALGGGIVLLGAATFLVGWGWSTQVAGQGFIRGVLLALAVFQLSAVTAAAGWRLTPAAELLGSYPRPEQAQLLGETVGDLSGWHAGNRQAIDMVIAGEPSAALSWYLRDLTDAQSTAQLTPTDKPSLVITPQQDQPPQLGAAYRGESFSWDVSPDWSAMKPLDWMEWLVFRKAPLKQTTIILWARSDLFLGANLTPGNPGQ